MANLLNYDAESGAGAIGDDSTPTLSLSNTSTGPGLEVDGLVVSSNATITNMTLSGGTAAANATVTGLKLVGNSIASGASFSLINDSSFVSVSTITFTTAVAGNVGAVRIVKPDGTFGWIPVMPDGAVTAIAV